MFRSEIQPQVSGIGQHRPRPALVLLWIAAFAITGCASYDGEPVPSGEIGASGDASATTRIGDVMVHADPYLERDRQLKIFHAEFIAHQILGVRVTVTNQGERSVSIRRSSMALVTADGTRLVPMDARLVAARVDPGTNVVFGTLLGLFGWDMQENSEASAQKLRVADYQAKQFSDAALDTGESASGFVYFIAPETDPQFAGGTLRVPVADGTGAVNSEATLRFAAAPAGN